MSSLAFALALAIPLGVIIAKLRRGREFTLSLASITQTIPSLAAMAFLVPIFGIGVVPTIIILSFYAIYPILKNTVVGICAVPSETKEAADAMGLSSWQRFYMVELPLSMPTILAGIRISTAMTIGIATIAAFIGAGGLGTFITQGLALNDMKRVMLGAIPAALLALGADFLLASTERLFGRRARQRHASLVVLTLFAIGIACVFWKMMQSSEDIHKRSIVVGSKNFTEQFILGEIVAQLIEAKTDLSVARKINLGTTDTVHQAMVFGDVDIYPEYTGTAYLTVLHRGDSPNAFEMFSSLNSAYRKQFDMTWLLQLGFSNSQTIAVRKDIAQRYNLKTLSDLSTVSTMINLAAPAEFVERIDAYPKLKKIYHLNFKSISQMDPNLMYSAVRHKNVDAIVAFSTDGRLEEFGLVALIDDKLSSLPYEASLVIRNEVLRRYPQIADALAHLKNAIDAQSMANMNADVELRGLSPSFVARRFLQTLSIEKYRPADNEEKAGP